LLLRELLTEVSFKGLKKVFSFDLRALAFFRISLGLITLYDLCTRYSFFNFFYSEQGVWPAEQALNYLASDKLSLYFLSDNILWAKALFFLNVIAAILFTTGYKTRLFACLTWLLLCSLQVRNIMVLNGGDNLLILLLFWSMFLPLGRVWSIDSKLENNVQSRDRLSHFSAATVGLFIQICSVYLFAAWSKTGAEWQSSFTALEYVLNNKQFQTNFALLLAEHSKLLGFLTSFVVRFELLFPTLLLIPAFLNQIRGISIFLMTGFHVGIGMCLKIGFFPLVNIVAILLLLPPFYWDKLEAFLNIERRKTSYSEQNSKHWFFSLTSIAFVLAITFVTQLNNFSGKKLLDFRLPKPIKTIRNVLTLNQNWALFAPYPGRISVYPYFEGKLKDGKTIDLYFKDRSELYQEVPILFGSTYPTFRHRKFFLKLRISARKRKTIFRPYAEHLCRNNKDLEKVKIAFLTTHNPPSPKPKKTRKGTSYNHTCQ